MPSGTFGARRVSLVVVATVAALSSAACDRAAPEPTSVTVYEDRPADSALTSPSTAASSTISDHPPLAGAVTVTGRVSSVTGTVDRSTLTAYAEMADAAVSTVSQRWSRPWPRTLAVVAPGDMTAFREQLGRTDDLRQVAAVTEGPVGADGRATRDRIVLNPDAFARLTKEGRQFVITHEATHVAVRSSLPGSAPLWLAEGYADHVGYSGSTRTPTELATSLLERVERGQGPTELPGADDLTSGTGDIAPAYLGAWLAVDLIARDHGESDLRRFVEASTVTGGEAAADAAADRAFVDVLGTTRATFTRQWLARLRTLAASD